MKQIAVSLILITNLLISATCDKEESPEFVELRFVLPFKIEPNKQEYNIGDTLWISANFPDKVLEHISGDSIKVVNYSFPTYLGFRKLLGKEFNLGNQPGVASSFEVVNKIGKATNQYETFNPFEIAYENGYYKCLIGVVPKKVGVYCLNFLSPKSDAVDFSSIDLGHNSKGMQRKGYYITFYYVINNGNVNLQLLRDNCSLTSDTLPIEINIFYEQKGTFTFEVVE